MFAAFARTGTLAARPLPNNSGHVMRHAIFEQIMAFAFAVLVTAGLIIGIYRAVKIDSWGLGIYIAILASFLGWLAILYMRKQRNVIELTDSAITWRRGSLVTVILWSEVVDFTEATSSTAWLVRARDGRTLRVDKLLVGVPTTFVDYLRRYLPPQLFDTALLCLRPKTALRALIKKRAGSN
jgi:hypothetical protein